MSRPYPDEPQGGGGGRDPPPKLYVGNISQRASLRDLEDLFAKYGRILNVEIKAAGYGFVEFDDPRDADDAVKALNDYLFEGKRLIVEHSRKHGGNNQNCFICGQPGHWVRECPENQDKNLDVRSGRCFKCGNMGHLAKYCRSRGDRGPAGGGYRGGRSRSRSPGYRRRSPSPRARDYGRSRRGPDPSPPPRFRGDRSPPRRRYDDSPRRDRDYDRREPPRGASPR